MDLNLTINIWKATMKKLWGNILYGIAKFLDMVLSALIKGLNWAVKGVENIRQGLMTILGCGFFFIMANPFTLLIFHNRALWTIIFILLFFPLLGSGFVSMLEYGKYVLTEFLYDQAEYYRKGSATKRPFNSYSRAYKRKRVQREQEKRRKAQQEQAQYWDQVFKNFRQNRSQGGWTYRNWGQNGPYQQGPYSGSYRGGQQNQQSSYGPGMGNPFDSFKQKYEQACDTLGVSYDTDPYQVKLAYRKMAKKYHPDINKAKGATEKFQKINAAYDFLSKENIDRYKNMTS